MTSSIDKTIEGFPFPTVSLIIGVPNYTSISKMHMKLNSNAVSVQSNLGCGTPGILYLTVSPAVYATLSASIFVVPVNPGSKPVIPEHSTGQQISDICHAYHAATTLFNEYYRTDKALWQLLLASVGEMYVRSLRHWYSGYSQTSTQKLLAHLYATYTNISPADLQENDAKLRAPYYANHPVENLFDEMENAVKYAADGNTSYSPEQVLTISFQLVFHTGHFLNTCKNCKCLPAASKTWATFKTFFATVHQEWRKYQVTTAGAGFQSANHLYQHKNQSANHIYQQ